MTTFIILVFIVILIIYLISYTIKYDTVLAFTGGLGSGKSFLSVNFAIKLLKKNRAKVWFYNFFHNKHKKVRPELYSSIPVKYKCFIWNKSEWSNELEEGHLLLTQAIEEKSVVFIDEIGSFASQFQFKEGNILDNFNEFIRLFRHYTKGGYLVVNDQCSENIVLEIRRRINTVFNLMHFKVWFKLFYTVRIRNISISEEIKTIEENDTEDNTTLKFGLMPFSRNYDTYCYSEKYLTVPKIKEVRYFKFKKNYLMTLPKKRFKKLTSNKKD